jgi:prolyl 4-hydroxylase
MSAKPPVILIPEPLLDWILVQRRNNVDAQAVYKAMIDQHWDPAIAMAAMEESVRRTNQKPPEKHPAIKIEKDRNIIDAMGHPINIVFSSKVPQVVVMDNFLSHDECDHLIAISEPRMKRSTTVDRLTGDDELNDVRTSTGTFLDKHMDPVVKRIEERLAYVCQWPEENGENLQILHYGVGAEYKPHYDYFEPDAPGTGRILQRGGQRVGTLIMYLNNPTAGGGTSFPDAGIYVTARKGSAVFFAYPDPTPEGKSLHGGQPVVEGEKWVATKWWRQRKFV